MNIVEVDLTRTGDWRALLRPHVCPPEAIAPYRVTVRVPPGDTAFLYPARLDQPLPTIKVPLRDETPDVMLALQPLIEQVYRNGRYASTLDYSRPCDPPMPPPEAAIVDEILQRAGRQ